MKAARDEERRAHMIPPHAMRTAKSERPDTPAPTTHPPYLLLSAFRHAISAFCTWRRTNFDQTGRARSNFARYA